MKITTANPAEPILESKTINLKPVSNHSESFSKVLTPDDRNRNKTPEELPRFNTIWNEEDIKYTYKEYTHSDMMPRSSEERIIIKVKFEIIFPYLIDLKKVDLIDTFIDIFQVKNKNLLHIFVSYGLEEYALYF